MAGEWIKMRTNLWDDPRVTRLCDLTDASEATIIGGLYWLWATADEHSEDGELPGLTLRSIDRKTGIAGFGAALVDVGWLTEAEQGVTLSRFNEHNGASAKSRAQTAKRVANHRGNAPVTQTPLQESNTSVSGALAREDKRREEEPSQALPKNKGGSDAASPAPRSPSKAARLPLDWVLPKALGDWALQERPDWTAEHVRKVADQFRDHWHAQGGANARKVDWAAAWRTWVRREPAGRVAGAGASAAPAAGWHETPEGVSAKGAELGLHQREGENRFVYRWRVLKAVGDAALIEKEVSAAARMNIAEHERAHQFFYGCLPGQMSRAA
ncbi:hypothetical protein [Ralstonia mannitolilytica]|uniref:hypothetical protein n=2 Tax=Ralstonia mannitolilytica TaxID=105219 RepID=UPI003B8BE170